MGDDFAAAVCHSVRKLGQALRGWVESDGGYISETLANAMKAACLFSEDSFPSNLSKLRVLICAVKRLAEEHDAACEEENTVLIHPSLALLEACRETILCEMTSRKRPRTRLEPVALLLEQGKGYAMIREQICRIYGWVDEGGAQYQKIDEELVKPGCHSYEDPDWMPPHDRRRAALDAQESQGWEEVWEAMAKKVARWNRKPAEPFEVVVKQGVHLHQVAKMFKMTTTEVLEKCRAENLPEPKPLDNIIGTRGLYDPAPDEASEAAERVFANRPDVATDSREDEGDEEPAFDEGLSQEAQIVQLHLGGNSNAKVAKHLGVAVARVKSVLARYEENPEAFDLGDEG